MTDDGVASHPSGTKHQHQPPSTMLRLQPLGSRSLKLSFPVSLRLQRSQSRWTSQESRRIGYATVPPSTRQTVRAKQYAAKRDSYNTGCRQHAIFMP
eukprot:390968-Rhodomonas_salina.1